MTRPESPTGPTHPGPTHPAPSSPSRVLLAVTLIVATPLVAYAIASTAGGALTWGEFALIALAAVWAIGSLSFRRTGRASRQTVGTR